MIQCIKGHERHTISWKIPSFGQKVFVKASLIEYIKIKYRTHYAWNVHGRKFPQLHVANSNKKL